MLFWTNFVWSDCVTASTQQRWKWKTSPFTSVSPGHLFPLWARWHCLVILEVKALLLRHSSPPVPFNPIAPVLFVHSWTIHLLLYHSIPSLLYQFRRIVLQRSRTGCNVSAGFKLWVAAENSSVVSLDTASSVQDIAVSCVGTQKALYPGWTLQPREDRVIVLHLVFQRYRTGANRCLLT